MIGRAVIPLLVIALAGVAGVVGVGCESSQTYRSDRVNRRPMTTDPFGGASLMTGTDFHNSKAASPDHDHGYFAIPRKDKPRD